MKIFLIFPFLFFAQDYPPCSYYFAIGTSTKYFLVTEDLDYKCGNDQKDKFKLNFSYLSTYKKYGPFKLKIYGPYDDITIMMDERRNLSENHSNSGKKRVGCQFEKLYTFSGGSCDCLNSGIKNNGFNVY